MIRIILVMLAAGALPFLAWFAWSAARGLARPAPVLPLSLAGVACALLAVALLALSGVDDVSRDGRYVPPSLEDGEIRPGRFVPSEAEPDPASDPAVRPSARR